MSLPEIPNAAFMASAAEAPFVDDDAIDAILGAAWPDLYAVALRHAARVIESEEGCPRGPVCTLRDLATEIDGRG